MPGSAVKGRGFREPGAAVMAETMGKAGSSEAGKDRVTSLLMLALCFPARKALSRRVCPVTSFSSHSIVSQKEARESYSCFFKSDTDFLLLESEVNHRGSVLFLCLWSRQSPKRAGLGARSL